MEEILGETQRWRPLVVCGVSRRKGRGTHLEHAETGDLRALWGWLFRPSLQQVEASSTPSDRPHLQACHDLTASTPLQGWPRGRTWGCVHSQMSAVQSCSHRNNREAGPSGRPAGAAGEAGCGQGWVRPPRGLGSLPALAKADYNSTY